MHENLSQVDTVWKNYIVYTIKISDRIPLLQYHIFPTERKSSV